jgi:hypothetical protein
MEFLVEFEAEVPAGTPDAEVEQHQRADSAAAAKLAGGRAPRPALQTAARRRRDDRDRAVPRRQPGRARPLDERPASRPFPDPGLPPRSHPGRTARPRRPRPGRRRIVPLTGRTFAGPEPNGKLHPGSSADWQTVLPDGTALGDIRYTLQTDDGDLLYVQSRSVRHGSADVLARLARGEDADASEYTFRTSTQIETAAPGLEWLNKGGVNSSAMPGAARLMT